MSIILKSSYINTPLGSMLSVSDDKALYLLEFSEREGLEEKIAQLQSKTKSIIVAGNTDILNSIAKELTSYFKGELKDFKTPFNLLGTPFQQRAWKELIQVPYGATKSYMEQAVALGRQKACRAVGNANGKNSLAIIVPCHRIINNNGGLGGYAGGLERKEWLLNHERAFA